MGAGACVDSFQATVLGGTQPPITAVPQNTAGASYTLPITGLANGIPLQFAVKVCLLVLGHHGFEVERSVALLAASMTITCCCGLSASATLPPA